MIGLAINGACGRMGTRLIALARASGDFNILAAIDRPDSEKLHQDAGDVAGIGAIGVPITFDLRAQPQVLVDFSAPAATRHWLKTCRDRRIPMVIGTTGLAGADHAAIDMAANDIPVLQAPNTSLGVNLLLKVARDVAARLGEEYDVEIVESHHRFKKDAPSGTALALADAILAGRAKTRDALVFGRRGESPRQPGQVGIHALRVGDEVGSHKVYFAALGERIELGHVATNRDTFAHGALHAAKWIVGQKPGRYQFGDVLGLQ